MEYLFSEQDLDLLQHQYLCNNLIIVVGSGLSVPLGVPSWKDLILEFCDDFQLSGEAREKVEQELAKAEYLEAIDSFMQATGIPSDLLQQKVADYFIHARNTIGKAAADTNYSDLGKMIHARYFTTNFDKFLEDISGGRKVYFDMLPSKVVLNQFNENCYDQTVVPLHGDVDRPETIVFTRDSYKGLYSKKDFLDFFEQIRFSKTFLFMGFSFDDVYFRSLFDVALGGFQAEHFILFPKSLSENLKINELWDAYRLKTIFYDISDGHVSGIRTILNQIRKVQDPQVALEQLKILPSGESDISHEPFASLFKECKQCISNENLGKVGELINEIEITEGFASLPATERIQVEWYRIWYLSNRQEYRACEVIIDTIRSNPELASQEDKGAFIYVQALWNSRRWDDAERIIGGAHSRKAILSLMGDIIKISRKFLPSADEAKNNVRVYGDQEPDEALKKSMHDSFLELKEKYVNPETYNLLHPREYGDCEEQQSAYWWLGIVSGQVLHEHEEAVQFLIRANEIGETRAVYEELGQNYLAIAENNIRYRKNAKQYDYNRPALRRARICFDHVFAGADSEYLKSAYRKCGSSYLQVLYDMRYFAAYEDFYAMAKDYLPENDHRYIQKAEVESSFNGFISDELMLRLPEEKREWFRLYTALNAAQIPHATAAEDTISMAALISGSLEKKYAEFKTMSQELQMLYLQTLLILGRNEEFISLCDPADEVMKCFVTELSGDVEKAEIEFLHLFEAHPDMSTLNEYQGYCRRNNRKNLYYNLCRKIIQGDYGYIAETSDVVNNEISAAINNWGDQLTALRVFCENRSVFAGSDTEFETEQMLRFFFMDAGDLNRRLSWSRYMLTICPPVVKEQFYRNIMFLFISNMQYDEAGKIIQEMRDTGMQVPIEWENAHLIMKQQQSSSRYSGETQKYNYGMIAVFKEELKKAVWFNQTCFGFAGQQVLLPMTTLILLFAVKRQNELLEFERVYVTYAGLIQLQNDLMRKETTLYRKILQVLPNMRNVEIVAPSLEAQNNAVIPGIENYPERMQFEGFMMEHPEVQPVRGIGRTDQFFF